MPWYLIAYLSACTVAAIYVGYIAVRACAEGKCGLIETFLTTGIFACAAALMWPVAAGKIINTRVREGYWDWP